MEANVTQFIDLTLKYQWSEKTELPDDEIQIINDLVIAAGFEVGSVTFGKLNGHYLDQDGSRTGETFSINGFCLLKIIDKENQENHRATGWLNYIMEKTVSKKKQSVDKKEITEWLSDTVRSSIPLDPILLTKENDLLGEYPPNGFLDGHTRDNHELQSSVGVHKYCQSWMERKRSSETHDVIFCRSCHLRIAFPREVKTYGQLRQYLLSQLF